MQKPIKMIANWKSILIIFIILLCIQTPSFAVTEVELQWDHSIDEPYLTSYRIYYDTDSRDVDPYDQTPKATRFSLNGTDWDPISGNDPVTVDKEVTQIFLRFSDDTQTYFFAVTAVDTRGLESDYSNEVSTLGITSINADPSEDGIHTDGDIVFTINFSEAVKLENGNLRITLDTDATIDIPTFALKDSVIVTYTVGANENSSDLNVTVITLQGSATLRNSGNIDCPRTLPSGNNLEDNNAIVVDTELPTSNVNIAQTTYDESDWNAANTIAGTANDGYSGVANVYLQIQRNSDNKYWDGSSWVASLTWVAATGTTDWTYSLDSSNLTVDVSYTVKSRATDNAGHIQTSFGSDTFQYTQLPSGNHAPEPPGLSSPENDASDVSLTSALKTNAFSDPDSADSGDTHAATRWQISTSNDFTDTDKYVFNIKSSANLTSLTVPEFVLNKDTPYYWRAAFYDNNDAVSDWSDSRSFTTINQNLFTDDNSNGIPDDQEVADTVDLDGDGISDEDEIVGDPDNYKSVNTVDEDDKVVGQMGISTENVAATIAMLTAVNPGRLPADDKPDDLPLGIVSFKLNVTPGAEVTVTIYLSKAAPSDAHWYKYSPAGGWLDCTALGYATFISDDRTSLLLTLIDGGYGDADGVENGVIIDPSGFGTPSASSSSTPGNASGGGCFIATAAYGSPLDKHVDILRRLRDKILLPTKWGQGFAKAYYHYSPPVADFIRDHDTARLMARWSLLPVVGLSWVALQIGAVSTLLLIFMVLSMGWLFLIKYRGLRHRVKVQGVGYKA